MKQQGNRYDRLIFSIKNNSIVALLIAFGAVVIALAAFTDSAKSLLSVFQGRPSLADVSGKWATETLTNPFVKNDTFILSFEFEVQGNTLLGTTMRKSTTGRYTLKDSVLGGKIDGNLISFHIKKQSISGDETVSYRNLYYGKASRNEIEFTLNSDRPWGFPSQIFVARRQR
jgi:hypothetical protein